MVDLGPAVERRLRHLEALPLHDFDLMGSKV
jgi:hypothetical protein